MNDFNDKLIEQYNEKTMKLLNKIAEHQAEIATMEALIRELQNGN